MKEWMLKHPIMTFLLADTLISGVLNCIASFAPNSKAETEENPEEEQNEEETV